MAWAICITAFLVGKRYCQTMLVKLSIWLLPLPKNPLTISTYQEKVCEFHDIIRRGCQNHLKPYNRLSCKLDWLTVFCQLFFSMLSVTLCILSGTSIHSVTLKKLVKPYDVKQSWSTLIEAQHSVLIVIWVQNLWHCMSRMTLTVFDCIIK